MVNEEEIYLKVELLEESPLELENMIEDWLSWQPHLAAYVFSDSFDLLNDQEREVFLFGAYVIVNIAREKRPKLESLDQEAIGELEEANWELLESQSGKNITQKIDGFFDSYPEPELLAFAEDLCNDEDEEDVTQVGGEIILVGLKTLIDLLFIPSLYASDQS